MKHIAASVSIFIRRHAALMFGLLMIVLLSIELCYLAYLCKRSLSIPRMAICFTDIAILMIPYWWLRGRWRVAAVVWCWVISMFLLANALYFRFWGHLLPLLLIPQAQNTNTVLIDSAIGVTRLQDITNFIFPLAITTIWITGKWRKAIISSHISIKRSFILTILTALLFILIQCGNIVHRTHDHTGRWTLKQNYGHKLRFAFDPGTYKKSLHILSFRDYGLVPHLFSEATLLFNNFSNLSISTDEFNSLVAYTTTSNRQVSQSYPSKNLIFILVESLDADVLGMSINGKEVTATMNRLCADSGTVWSSQVRTQIAVGNSSDGQMMYNLGLLPTQNGTATVEFISSLDSIPGLARLLPSTYHTQAIFADGGNGWYKKSIYRKYGFNDIFTNREIEDHISNATSPDGALLQFALLKAKQLHQPFTMQLLTLQMHYPSNFKGVAERLDFGGTGLSEDRRNYLNSTADFDRHLGAFIDGLKKEGLWDNTVLVIASDHNYPNTKKPDGSRGDIVFIAANCDTTLAAGPVNQVDVFPTVLDIMGVESRWRGVGNSMLGPRRGQSDPRQATVSDSILRSDFFKRQ